MHRAYPGLDDDRKYILSRKRLARKDLVKTAKDYNKNKTEYTYDMLDVNFKKPIATDLQQAIGKVEDTGVSDTLKEILEDFY